MATRPALGFGEPGSRLPTAQLDAAGAGGIAVPIHLEPDPQMAALLGLGAATSTATPGAGLAADAAPQLVPRRTAVADPPAPSARNAESIGAASPNGNGQASRPAASAEAGVPTGEDPSARTAPGRPKGSAGGGCVEARRVADERCSVAALAKEQADAALGAVRAAQRAYDAHMTQAEAAAAAADPRGVRAEKERAQHAFREARAAANTREAIEAAARDWLNEINRINREARDATNTLVQEREAAHGLVTTIERLTVEADGARVAAEAAAETCVAARQAVADCEEAQSTGGRPAGTWPVAASVGADGGGDGPAAETETELAAAFDATGAGEPAVLRLLRGDRASMNRLVDELGGDDPRERRRWQLAIGGLLEAVIARAIEAGYLHFPVDHGFWSMNTLQENRDVALALSSLGYRFDGLGGWADDRIPGQRDLSLAVGYAGLDPMRTRRWPREQEMQDLFSDVSVAADEYLVSAAGGLTLGELISVLGRRADGLADLWNEWGRVRPLLLSGG